MALTFPFEKVPSSIFGTVYRPVTWVEFWSKSTDNWVGIWMVIDSGADYTLLPRYMSKYLGVDLRKDCVSFTTSGIGGKEKVFLLKRIKVKLGDWKLVVPLGFLEHDDIPPLLGRQDFMEKFATLFFKHKTIFSDKRSRY